MVEAFGGRVTSSISGKTDILLVGKEPGYAKVSQAQSRGGIALLSLEDVRVSLIKGSVADAVRLRRSSPVEIEDFSAGFRGNGAGSRLGHKQAGAGTLARGAWSKAAMPTTGAIVQRTASRVPTAGKSAEAAAKEARAASASRAAAAAATAAAATPAARLEAAVKASKGPVYCAAPVETIDISQLKPTRFLLPPAALPYRDEAGRISLTLLRDAAAKVEAGDLEVPPEVVTTLTKWRRHAEKEVAKGGHAWVLTAEGAWAGPGGELREVIAGTGGETDEEDGSDDGDNADDDDGDGGDQGSAEAAEGAEAAEQEGGGADGKRKAASLVDGEDEAEGWAEGGSPRKRPTPAPVPCA